MSLPAELPELVVLPTEALHPHERMDEQRAHPLVEALQRDGRLRNPPIVSPMDDEEQTFVVLDGANRVTAFRLLGLPHIVAQVVRPPRDHVEVEAWSHVVLGLSGDELVRSLTGEVGLALKESTPAQAGARLEQGQALALLCFSPERVYEVDGGSAGGTLARVDRLARLVAAYHQRCRLERTLSREVDGLPEVFPEFTCLVVFPRFRLQDVIAVVREGRLFPPGITRFIVSPRALHINYPLERLASQDPLAEKQRALEAWIQERVRGRRVRYYAEATVLFDE